ncbi:MAG: GAF domain-containing protein [Anaerolineae bacterium]
METSHAASSWNNLFYRIAHAINASLKLEDTLEAILTVVRENLTVRAALIRLLDADARELNLVASVGLSEAYLEKGRVLLSESGIDRQVLEGQPTWVADVTCAPGFQYPEQARREGLCGMLAVPLQVRGRSIGVLRVYCEGTRAFSKEETLLLQAVADLGAVAIEKAQLHQGLFRIAEALSSTLDLEAMLSNVLQATVTEMRIKAASVRLRDRKGKKLVLVAAHGLSQAYLDKGEVQVDRSPIDQHVLQGEPVVLFDVTHDVGFQYPEEAAREGVRSVLAVPLRLREHVIGVMRAYSAQPRRFGPVATEFLLSVADLTAVAIENARLHAALKARYEDLKSDLTEWYRFLALG